MAGLTLWCLFAEAAGNSAAAEAAIKKGDLLLAKGEASYLSAEQAYTNGLGLDPELDTRIRLRRGEVRLKMRRYDAALEDTGAVLQAHINHKGALLLKAKVELAAARFLPASATYALLASVSDARKRDTYTAASQACATHDHAVRAARAHLELVRNPARRTAPGPQQRGQLLAAAAAAEGQELRLLAAELALESWEADSHGRLSQTKMAEFREDVAAVLRKEPTNRRALLFKAIGLIAMGADDAARAQLVGCVKLDEEAGECRALSLLLKSYMADVAAAETAREERRYHDVLRLADVAVSKVAKMRVYDGPRGRELRKWVCGAHHALNDYQKGLSACDAAVADEGDGTSDSADVFLDRAELRAQAGDFAGAEADVNKVQSVAPQAMRLHQVRDKVQRLRKRAETKDYYAILGVARDASVQTIKKRWRELSGEKHPDKMPADATKEARAKMLSEYQDINNAYDVLRDSEKRARYDAGEDVDKPQQQQQQQGFGFGGFPFGNAHFRFQ